MAGGGIMAKNELISIANRISFKSWGMKGLINGWTEKIFEK